MAVAAAWGGGGGYIVDAADTGAAADAAAASAAVGDDAAVAAAAAVVIVAAVAAASPLPPPPRSATIPSTARNATGIATSAGSHAITAGRRSAAGQCDGDDAGEGGSDDAVAARLRGRSWGGEGDDNAAHRLLPGGGRNAQAAPKNTDGTPQK